MNLSRPHQDMTHAGRDGATAVVESLSYDGRGVARVDGKTVFIEGALPGERVRFRYFNRLKRHDSAGLIELLEASPDRVTPPCPGTYRTPRRARRR